MMYVFICPKCARTRMVSLQRKLICADCGTPMANCEIEFSDWIRMDEYRRRKLVYFYCHTKQENLCFFRPMPFYDRTERNYYC